MKKAWAGYQAVGAAMRDRDARMVELTNDEYFAPLQTWLDDQNRKNNNPVGW